MNKTTEALKLAEEIFSGMLHGTDWNNGTHANIYRPKFPKALAAIREALADHSGGANEMVAEPAIPEWVDVDDYEEPVKQEPVAWMAKNGEVCRHGWRKFHAREEDVYCVRFLLKASNCLNSLNF